MQQAVQPFGNQQFKAVIGCPSWSIQQAFQPTWLSPTGLSAAQAFGMRWGITSGPVPLQGPRFPRCGRWLWHRGGAVPRAAFVDRQTVSKIATREQSLVAEVRQSKLFRMYESGNATKVRRRVKVCSRAAFLIPQPHDQTCLLPPVGRI